jgi:hypothetical protein
MSFSKDPKASMWVLQSTPVLKAPCTKGIWVWGTPIPGKSPEGKPMNILVIDTEGIGALDEDSNHDTKIFSLAVLLSSLFIYNR